jgi:hypothetical protein
VGAVIVKKQRSNDALFVSFQCDSEGEDDKVSILHEFCVDLTVVKLNAPLVFITAIDD